MNRTAGRPRCRTSGTKSGLQLAIGDVSFSLQKGPIAAICDSGGAGLAALLSVLLGTTKPAARRVLVGGMARADAVAAGFEEPESENAIKLNEGRDGAFSRPLVSAFGRLNLFIVPKTRKNEGNAGESCFDTPV